MNTKTKMKGLTVSLTERQIELLSKLVDGGKFLSRSEAVRHIIERYIDGIYDSWKFFELYINNIAELR